VGATADPAAPGDPVRTPSARRSVVLLALSALAGAALVLVTPGIVRGDGVPLAVPVVLAVVCLGGGLAARAARPDRPRGRRPS